MSFLTPFCSLHSSWSSWASLGRRVASAHVASSIAHWQVCGMFSEETPPSHFVDLSDTIPKVGTCPSVD
jgi:hypothetical protein